MFRYLTQCWTIPFIQNHNPKKKIVQDIEKDENSSQPLPGIIVLPIGGEVPQKGPDDPNTEFQVYSRRTCTKGTNLPIIPTQDQPKSPRDGPENISGILILASIVPSNNEPIDLDVPIAIRNGDPIMYQPSYCQIFILSKTF